MNYGKRRLFFVSKQQEKDGWLITRHRVNKQKRLRFTVKQWKKFDYSKQAWLCKIYHVTLTNYKIKWRYRNHSPTPLKEKLKMGVKSLPDKLTVENLQKGTKMVSNGIDDFSKSMQEFKVLDGPKQNYSFLDTGKKDYSFLTGTNKETIKTKRKKKKSKAKDYSFLTVKGVNLT